MKDSHEIGSFIDGCIEELYITNDEKVLLMKLGVRYGYKLNWFCGQDETVIKGCKSVRNICMRLRYDYNVNILDTLNSRISAIDDLLRNYDFRYHIAKEVVINLIRLSYLENIDKDKVINILCKFDSSFSELKKYKTWRLKVIRDISDKIFKSKYDENKRHI